MSNVGANASDVGLIVQGTLIFLSAVVAVIGYLVQAKLARSAAAHDIQTARAERHKDARLQSLQNQLSNLIGPVQSLIQTGHNMVFTTAARNAKLGTMQYYMSVMGGKEGMSKHMKGEKIGLRTWLMPDQVEEIAQTPKCKVGKEFRMMMECALEECFSPAAEILKRNMNDLPVPSREDFIAMFPVYKNEAQLRKKPIVEFIAWTYEMNKIVSREWSQGEFSRVHGSIDFPIILNKYLIMMLDKVKEEITMLTSSEFSFNLISTSEEYTKIQKMVTQQLEENSPKQGSTSPAKGEPKSEKKNGKKYITGAVAGALDTAVLASVVSER